jgi:hypothetical protein
LGGWRFARLLGRASAGPLQVGVVSGEKREVLVKSSLAPEVLVELTASTSHRITLAPHELIVNSVPLASGRAPTCKWVETRGIGRTSASTPIEPRARLQ